MVYKLYLSNAVSFSKVVKGGLFQQAVQVVETRRLDSIMVNSCVALDQLFIISACGEK